MQCHCFRMTADGWCLFSAVCELLGVGFADGTDSTDAITRCTIYATHFMHYFHGQSNCRTVCVNPQTKSVVFGWFTYVCAGVRKLGSGMGQGII